MSKLQDELAATRLEFFRITEKLKAMSSENARLVKENHEYLELLQHPPARVSERCA
jgi:hypothetical protein